MCLTVFKDNDDGDEHEDEDDDTARNGSKPLCRKPEGTFYSVISTQCSLFVTQLRLFSE